MENQARARIRIDEELARTPTVVFRPDPTTSLDDGFQLDQGFNTNATDLRLRKQDRQTLLKSQETSRISVESEYFRRDSENEIDGPLDMGFIAVSKLDGTE